MTYEEAICWLKGEGSMCNTIFSQMIGGAEAERITAQCDDAKTQQAYWIVRAHQEKLV